MSATDVQKRKFFFFQNFPVGPMTPYFYLVNVVCEQKLYIVTPHNFSVNLIIFVIEEKTPKSKNDVINRRKK